MKTIDTPLACMDTYSIYSGDKTCALGNTKEFRFAWILCHKAPHYVSYNDIAELVWDSDFYDPHLIKNMKLRVKKKLQQAGMDELAERIESTPQHYRLTLK